MYTSRMCTYTSIASE